MAGDLVGALADLDACCAAYPNDPEFLLRRAMILLPLGRIDDARAALQHAHAIHPGAGELLLRFADAAVITVRRGMLEPFVC
jgi:Flp pilus assembly protein TadD